MKPITADVVAQVHANLSNDYPGVTLEYVQAQVDAITTGERPKNIIGMLAESMLKKNGYLS